MYCSLLFVVKDFRLGWQYVWFIYWLFMFSIIIHWPIPFTVFFYCACSVKKCGEFVGSKRNTVTSNPYPSRENTKQAGYLSCEGRHSQCLPGTAGSPGRQMVAGYVLGGRIVCGYHASVLAEVRPENIHWCGGCSGIDCETRGRGQRFALYFLI